MRKGLVLGGWLLAAAVFFLAFPHDLRAQGDGVITTSVADPGYLVTVRDSPAGEVLSLYRIRDDRIVLVDTVVNTNKRASSDTSFSKRYVIHVDIENR